MWRRLAAVGPVLLAATLLAACAGRTVTKEGTEGGYSTSMTMSGGPDQARLDVGREAAMNGEYDRAAEAFTEVYLNTAAKSEHREQALFELGMLYSQLLNPGKDYAKARSYFEKLLVEFPKTSLRERAEKRLEDLQKIEGTDTGK